LHARGGSGPTIARLAIAWLLLLAAAGAASAGCPPEPLRLTAAGFALAANAQALPGAASLAPLTLPDAWRERRPGVGGFAWYRFALPAGEGGDERCAVLLPDVNMNAAVFVNGKWIGEGGSLEEPVAHNFNRPLYFTFPSALLAGRDDHVDVLLYAYPYHFGRLGPVWVGPNRLLVSRYESAFFRQITLAQVGAAMAVVTILLVGVIWIGSGFQRLLLAALRGRLEPTLERRKIRFRWRVLDAPTPERFGPEQMLNLLRIVQEAITNAVRHGDPSVIEVATSVDDGRLVIAVRDDGRGLPRRLQRGRGLANMERRAQEIGGLLHITSNGEGTLVELRLPLR
jgi:hypothetical protein